MNQRQHIILRYLLGASVNFLGMAILGCALYPQIFHHPFDGVSYFASQPKTVLVFTVGFAGTIAGLIGIVRQLRPIGSRAKPLRRIMWAAAICLLGIAITAYPQNRAVYDVHVGFVLLLTAAQLIGGVWIIRQRSSHTLDYVLFTVFTACVVVSALPVVKVIPVFRFYPLRECLVFVSALGLVGRAALRAAA